MAGWLEAASGALTLLSFWSALPRFSDLGSSMNLGAITFSPSGPLTVPANAPVSTVVATFSVQGGGSSSYSYALVSDQLGYFTIVGNQLQVNAAMVPGIDNLLVQATGNAGDVLELPMQVVITAAGVTPTYFLYGF
jgi:hypothetical protein